MHSENSSDTFQVILDFLWSPFRTVKLFLRDLSTVDESLKDDSMAVRFLAMVTMPFQLIGGFLSLMVQNWPTSRSGIAAVSGVPAFLTLVGLLSAWILADYFRSDTKRVLANQGYYQFNVENHSDTPESALAYAKKLVELDPEDAKLKFQLGIAQVNADNDFAANDAMKSIAPDDEEGHLEAHLWRANYLVQNKTAEEFKEALGLAEKHLAMATSADPENLAGRAQLATTYTQYANLLEEKSPERLEYLLKADELFREIVADDSQSPINSSIKISTLSPSVLVRKQLEAIAPETYSVESEIARVRARITSLLNVAIRFNPDSLRLWLLLIDSASEIRQFDFAVEIADKGLKSAPSPATKNGIAQAKSLALRKAALSINKFDDIEAYKKRFFYLCDAIRIAPQERSNYALLLQFIGNENEQPTIQLARQLGLAEPGDAVPINLKWLRRACVETKYTGFLNVMIGLHEFHLGNREAGIKTWSVAQQFDPSTRDLINKVLELNLISNQDKLNNFEIMFSESLELYPEAIRIRVLRGNYYFKVKKFQEAIDDFRLILVNYPNEIVLNQRIKICYQFMGQRRAAADEQKIIDAKLKKLPVENQIQFREVFQKMEEQGAG